MSRNFRQKITFNDIYPQCDRSDEEDALEEYERRQGESAQGHALRVARLPSKPEAPHRVVDDADAIDDTAAASLAVGDAKFSEWLESVRNLKAIISS